MSVETKTLEVAREYGFDYIETFNGDATRFYIVFPEKTRAGKASIFRKLVLNDVPESKIHRYNGGVQVTVRG